MSNLVFGTHHILLHSFRMWVQVLEKRLGCKSICHMLLGIHFALKTVPLDRRHNTAMQIQGSNRIGLQ